LKCKAGFTLVNNRCRLCKFSEVFDPVSKRCFSQKMNNYIDINYNRAYGDIIVSDIFGLNEKDMTAMINFDIDYAKQNEFGEKIKVNPAVFKITAIDGENEFNYNFSNMPLTNRRNFMINTPFPKGKQLKIKVNVMTEDPSEFANFALRNFRYSLQKKQDGKKT